MPRTARKYKSYNAARRFVSKLGLNTMQDWINYSKGSNPDGHKRPQDIPSNPWLVYKDELEAQGKKFSINEFIGSKRSNVRNTMRSQSSRMKQANVISRKKRVKDVANVKENKITYHKAKEILNSMHVRSVQDFNALKRMELLPNNFPEKPNAVFKNEWNGWNAFLS